MFRVSFSVLIVILFVIMLVQQRAYAQSVQQGIDATVKSNDRLRIDYVGYRAARCETERCTEIENERPNRGGLICVYYTNVSGKPMRLAFWRANGRDESHWRLGGFLAWDRCWDRDPAPGKQAVLEIDAVSEEFAEGKPFSFAYAERPNWRSTGRYETVLREDPVRIACIRVLPGMREVEVHVRHTGADKVTLESLDIAEHPGTVRWVGQEMEGPANAIGRATLEKPLQVSELIIVKLGVRDGKDLRCVYAHRRAFEDQFPIATWSANPKTYALLRRLHIDTVIRGGKSDDEFFAQAVPKYGFRTMVGVGVRGTPVDVDTLRDLGNHPAVTCWMLADEPDWSVQADVMAFVDRAVRTYNATKPTYINLCRNVKFFEYAPIADIPSMDHYAVTVSHNTKWPRLYGTYLEETAYYTRDLKRAAEPKPIWVWSQAIASWSGRPKRPVPTPNELAAQLMLNLGRGAKGIWWFNYEHAVAEKYPDVREAMKRWGRVLCLTRGDFLASEPYEAQVKAPEKIDVAPLATWDKVLICVTNLNYEIHPEGYPFTVQKEVEITLRLPAWIDPKTALLIDPDGVKPVPFKAKKGKAELTVADLEACQLIIMANDEGTDAAYKKCFAKILEDEQREF